MMGGCANGSKKYMGSLVLYANIYHEFQHLPELILFQAHLIDIRDVCTLHKVKNAGDELHIPNLQTSFKYIKLIIPWNE